MPIGRPVETILGVSSLFPQDESSRTNFEGIPPDVGRTGGIVGMGGIGAISDLAVGPCRTARLHSFTGPSGPSVAWNCPRPCRDRWYQGFGGPGRDRTDDLFHAISHFGASIGEQENAQVGSPFCFDHSWRTW